MTKGRLNIHCPLEREKMGPTGKEGSVKDFNIVSNVFIHKDVLNQIGKINK